MMYNAEEVAWTWNSPSDTWELKRWADRDNRRAVPIATVRHFPSGGWKAFIGTSEPLGLFVTFAVAADHLRERLGLASTTTLDVRVGAS